MSFAETFAPVLLTELGVAADDPEIARKTAGAEQALELALVVVENYLDRKLEFLDPETETFGPGVLRRLLLRRYPVASVSSITVQGIERPADSWFVDREAGILHLWGWAAWAIVVTYSGGFKDDEWPPDLLMVLLELAASLYPGVLEAGVPVLGAIEPAIRRISVPDVGTIEYADAGNTSLSVLGFGVVPQAYLGVLNRYRAASAVGGA
jgi:hypothetical protein